MRNEATVQTEVRLAMSKLKGKFWRNNSGVLFDKNNRPVRFGLGNDSKKINAVMKSSDLIGCLPVVVTHEMVGHTVGVFVAVEVKKEGWIYSGNAHELGQMNYINTVSKLGGIAGFINSTDNLYRNFNSWYARFK